MKSPDFTSLDRLTAISGAVLNVGGLRITFLSTNNMDEKSGWFVPPHQHSFYEFHYVRDGLTVTVLAGKRLELSPGQFYVIPPGTIHSHEETENMGHQGMAARWSLAFEDKHAGEGSWHFLPELLGTVVSSPIADRDGEIFGLFSDFARESSRPKAQEPSVLALFALFLVKTGELIAANLNIEPGLARPDQFSAHPDMELVMRFMLDNLSSPMGVDDIAKANHMSYAHLCRSFRKATGMTVMDYLTELRLSKSEELLTSTGLTLREIAEKTGFTDEFHLSKVFKARKGMAPSIFRNKIKNITK